MASTFRIIDTTTDHFLTATTDIDIVRITITNTDTVAVTINLFKSAKARQNTTLTKTNRSVNIIPNGSILNSGETMLIGGNVYLSEGQSLFIETSGLVEIDANYKDL